MKQRGIIVSPLASGEDLRWLEADEQQWQNVILCADGGYDAALKLGLKPDLLIGDLDSIRSETDVCCPVKHHPAEKDETDTILCLQEGVAMGLERMVLLGGFGGRLDHTYANLQTMAHAITLGIHLEIFGQGTRAMLLQPGFHQVRAQAGCKLSLFAYSPQVEGITLRGLHYPLTNSSLSANFPLGISNSFESDCATIEFRQGLLLVMIQKDEGF